MKQKCIVLPGKGSSMASFGESLRREREMRGVSLEEISATTKINLRFLQALEADDFAKVPGGLFARSFLRAYASYLGLDTERLLAEYQLVAPQVPEGTSHIGMTKLPQGRRGSVNRFAPWAVAVPLLTAGYLLYRYAHRTPAIPVSVVTVPASSGAAPTRQGEANPSSQSSASVAATAGIAEAGEPAQSSNTVTTKGSVGQGLTGAQNAPSTGQSNLTEHGSSATGTPGPGSENTAGHPVDVSSGTPTTPTIKGSVKQGDLVLEVATTERAWVAVDADGKAIFQRTLDPNEVKTFTAKDSFEVWTGNAQGTVLTLNGTRQKSLGRKGEIKRIHLTRNSGGQQPAP